MHFIFHRKNISVTFILINYLIHPLLPSICKNPFRNALCTPDNLKLYNVSNSLQTLAQVFSG